MHAFPPPIHQLKTQFLQFCPSAGKALDMYSWLKEADVTDYGKVKAALLKRYDYADDGYRNGSQRPSLRWMRAQSSSFVWLQNYLDRWVQLAKVDMSYEGVTALLVREQFINAVPMDLVIHL